MRRRTAVSLGIGLSGVAAAYAVGFATAPNTTPKPPAVPAACAEAMAQAPVANQSQIDTYMRGVGSCILGLEQIAPASDRPPNHPDTVIATIASTGVSASVTMSDKRVGGALQGWSMTSEITLVLAPGKQVDIFSPIITTSSSADTWHGTLETDNESRTSPAERNANDDIETMATIADWQDLQTASNGALSAALSVFVPNSSSTSSSPAISA